MQYLADRLCEDDEMQYVIKKEKDIASLEKIDVSNVDSIFTKMKKYPYEFEINGQLQLASINGVKVANKDTIPEGYIKPEGTKNITENGENIDVREYEKVNVNVQTWEVLETGIYSIPSTGKGEFHYADITLKNNYTEAQQARFLITSLTNVTYDVAWYVRAISLNQNIVGNTFSTVFDNRASITQAGTVNYAIVGIANPE